VEEIRSYVALLRSLLFSPPKKSSPLCRCKLFDQMPFPSSFLSQGARVGWMTKHPSLFYPFSLSLLEISFLFFSPAAVLHPLPLRRIGPCSCRASFPQDRVQLPVDFPRAFSSISRPPLGRVLHASLIPFQLLSCCSSATLSLNR